MSTTRLAITTIAAAVKTVAEITGKSNWLMACRLHLPDAVDLEDVLGEDRAGEQTGEVEAEDRHDRARWLRAAHA